MRCRSAVAAAVMVAAAASPAVATAAVAAGHPGTSMTASPAQDGDPQGELGDLSELSPPPRPGEEDAGGKPKDLSPGELEDLEELGDLGGLEDLEDLEGLEEPGALEEEWGGKGKEGHHRPPRGAVDAGTGGSQDGTDRAAVPLALLGAAGLVAAAGAVATRRRAGSGF